MLLDVGDLLRLRDDLRKRIKAGGSGSTRQTSVSKGGVSVTLEHDWTRPEYARDLRRAICAKLGNDPVALASAGIEPLNNRGVVDLVDPEHEPIRMVDQSPIYFMGREC